MANAIKEYSGEQIILSSNQLLFNARKDNIELLSGNVIHLSANNSVQIDVGVSGKQQDKNVFIVNAPKIRLGLKTKGRTVEPVVKGDALEKALNDLMDAIEAYSDLVTASIPPFSPLLGVASTTLKMKLRLVRDYISPLGNIKSDTTLTI